MAFKNKNNRLSHWSNPSVTFEGVETGKTGKRDNVRKMRETACDVSNNFPNPIEENPISFSVNAPFSLCLCEEGTISVSMTGNTSSIISYVWEVSTNGIDFVPKSFCSGSICNYEMPCNESNAIYWKVTVLVYGSPFYSRSSFIVPRIPTGEPNDPCAQLQNEEEPQFRIQEEHSQDYSVFPNPTNKHWTLFISLQGESAGNWVLLNSSGQDVSAFSGFRKSGKNQILIDGSNLNSGMYFLKSDKVFLKLLKF